MKEYLVIGEILKPQGVKGELKIKTSTDENGRFAHLESLFIEGKSYAVEGARVADDFVYLKLEGIDDANAAETLRGKQIEVDRAHARKLPKGRFFIADLIGMTVVDETGATLGILKDVFQNGPTDVYQVKGEKGFLFPALKRVILQIEPEKGLMTLDSQALDEVAVYDD